MCPSILPSSKPPEPKAEDGKKATSSYQVAAAQVRPGQARSGQVQLELNLNLNLTIPDGFDVRAQQSETPHHTNPRGSEMYCQGEGLDGKHGTPPGGPGRLAHLPTRLARAGTTPFSIHFASLLRLT